MSAPASDSPLTVFVGGIPFAATQEEITAWFTERGLAANAVKSVEIPQHAASGRVKGYAVVEFATEAQAKQAIALDHQDMGSRYLNIRAYKAEPPQREEREPKAKKARKPRAPKEAGASSSAPREPRAPKEKKERAPREPRPAKAPFQAPAGWKVVFIGNLPWSTTEDQLKALFNAPAATVRLGWDQRRDRAKGFAHIDFTTGEQAAAAVARSGMELEGRELRINFAPEKQEEPAAAQ